MAVFFRGHMIVDCRAVGVTQILLSAKSLAKSLAMSVEAYFARVHVERQCKNIARILPVTMPNRNSRHYGGYIADFQGIIGVG